MLLVSIIHKIRHKLNLNQIGDLPGCLAKVLSLTLPIHDPKQRHSVNMSQGLIVSCPEAFLSARQAELSCCNPFSYLTASVHAKPLGKREVYLSLSQLLHGLCLLITPEESSTPHHRILPICQSYFR